MRPVRISLTLLSLVLGLSACSAPACPLPHDGGNDAFDWCNTNEHGQLEDLIEQQAHAMGCSRSGSLDAINSQCFLTGPVNSTCFALVAQAPSCADLQRVVTQCEM